MKKFKDTLFAKKGPVKPFEFDSQVASVFDEMADRSIPFYAETQRQILSLIQKWPKPIRRLYDLGTSTGRLVFFLAEQLNNPAFEALGLDSSKAMIDVANQNLSQLKLKGKFEFECADVLSYTFKKADAVVLNYILQFLPIEKRPTLLKKIYNTLPRKGLLILSEKTRPNQPILAHLFSDCHDDFRISNHYSRLEIAQKRKALEKKLITLSLEENLTLMRKAGFKNPEPFLTWHNFTSIVAIKD